MTSKHCKATTNAGHQCGAYAGKDSDFCRLHDPELAEVVQEARRLGGVRRKREATLSVAYDFEGLRRIGDIQRYLEVAGFDLLGLDASINKSRVMGGIAQVAMKLLQEGELAERVEAIEAALGSRLPKPMNRSRR